MQQTPGQLIQEFLNYLKFQKRYSQHTITSYKNDLDSFFTFIGSRFGETALPDIKAAFVRSWLAELKETGIESKSINRKISSLKSFFKYQLRQERIEATPMASILSPKIKKRLPQIVAAGGIQTLFQHVEFPDDWDGRTQRLVLELFYNTGMRQAELIGLKENQVDKSNNTVKVLGKGSKERIIPISVQLTGRLSEYMADKPTQLEQYDRVHLLVTSSGKKLYQGYVYNTVKKYLSLVTTIDKKSPHVLRHTFATHLMNSGADLNAVKELLGHSSLAATQVYTHNSIEKLKDVHKKSHPKA
ncbi:MAG TPA: tyrosine-type recombinase/integrase [Ferruginibacter sp.]|nr:tyrosine-type recombinase/integrase [Ferruginibacter sp.]